MIVAFKHREHDDDALDLLISTLTLSKFIHTQIIFSNGLVGSSWIKEGVAIKTINDVVTYPSLFTYVKIKDDKVDEKLVYDFFLANLGIPFDMKGAMLLAIIPYFEINENKYHCSKVCFEALKYGGMKTKYNNTQSVKVSPSKLFKILTN